MQAFNAKRRLGFCLVLAIGQATCAYGQSAPLAITDSGQGQVSFSSSAISELSGITYLGSDSYAVVSDSNGKLAPATILIDRSTGQITSASLGTPITVAGGNDLEGIAYDRRDGSVLISDESGNTITRHQLSNGALLGSITVPSIYANAVGNRGLESLSLDPLDFNLWTANEEALTTDGPQSTQTQGTIVRLQQFDSTGQPAGQYGYLTEPHAGGLSASRSGVSDLIALPGGGLIVMERELGLTYRIRLHAIDLQDAADTTNTASLDGVASGLASKTLLHQVDAGFSNFEGISLGPMLNNGDFALVLVSDDGAAFNPQNLLTLRLSGIAVDGDLTGDFLVDQSDLGVVLGAWGNTVAAGNRLAGDPDGDGKVGIEDLDIVLANWTGEMPIVSIVPEPASAWVGASALLVLSRRW